MLLNSNWTVKCVICAHYEHTVYSWLIKLVVQLVLEGKEVRKDREVDQDIGYKYVGKSTSSGRIDLNDLIERAHTEKKREGRTNFLILSCVASVTFIVVLIISL